MAITINGSGTIGGVSVGGLPDGIVDNDTLASGIASSKLTGALPAIDGSALTATGVQSITSASNSNSAWLYTVNYNGHQNGEQRVTATVTPSTNNSLFYLTWNMGVSKNNDRVAFRSRLYVNDSETSLHTGTSYFHHPYQYHRASHNGTGYWNLHGNGWYTTTATSSQKFGIYVDIYDESTNSTVEIARSSTWQALLQVVEFAR